MEEIWKVRKKINEDENVKLLIVASCFPPTWVVTLASTQHDEDCMNDDKVEESKPLSSLFFIYCSSCLNYDLKNWTFFVNPSSWNSLKVLSVKCYEKLSVCCSLLGGKKKGNLAKY